MEKLYYTDFNFMIYGKYFKTISHSKKKFMLKFMPKIFI